MDQKCTNDIRFSNNENLAWLTHQTEDPKNSKGNLTFPPHIKCD